MGGIRFITGTYTHTLSPLVFLNSKWNILKEIIILLSLLFAGYNSQITGGENACRLSCVNISKNLNIKVNAVDSLLVSVLSARVYLNLIAFQLPMHAAFPFSVDEKKKVAVVLQYYYFGYADSYYLCRAEKRLSRAKIIFKG